MDGTKFNRRFLKMLLNMQCEKETLDYVTQEMRAVLGEKMPEEDAEVNFRMICDMVRYQNMKEAGMVHSVDEFLQLLRSGRTQNE